MSKMTLGGRTIYYSRFSSLEVARSWMYRAKNEAMVLGDIDEDGNGEIWVMRISDAARCENAGYIAIYR